MTNRKASLAKRIARSGALPYSQALRELSEPGFSVIAGMDALTQEPVWFQPGVGGLYHLTVTGPDHGDHAIIETVCSQLHGAARKMRGL